MWPPRTSPLAAGSSGLNAGGLAWPSPVPVPTACPRPQEGRLTYEGLFVGASLLHVGAWPDSTAAVVHLVHDMATQKEDRGEAPFIAPTL